MKNFINIILLATFLFSNCTANEDSPLKDVDLNEALLTDFKIKEIDYLKIDIKQPEIKNNVETKKGEIIITVPYTTTGRLFSLKSVNIDTEVFSITPSVGTKKIFSETEWLTYTVSSKKNTENSISYDVKIVVGPNPDDEELLISDFELLATDNSHANMGIKKESLSIQTVDSILVCLFPKSIDFTNLTPSIKYKGAKIEYRINGKEFKEYPIITRPKIDFKYPNKVDFKITNSTGSVSTIYRILVDTESPIVFNKQEVIFPDVKVGDSYNLVGVTTWTNAGNYPISTMSPNEYTHVITPATGLKNIFQVRLSKNSGGDINPGENGLVNILVANCYLRGGYESTSVFKLMFNENTWGIVQSPVDDYRFDIGYKNVELNVIGKVID